MKKLLFIFSLFGITGLTCPVQGLTEEDIVPLSSTPAAYEERLNFNESVKNILDGLNQRISELKSIKDDPYTTIYSTLKQKRDAIEYQLNYVDTLERGEWDATRQEIMKRVNE